MGYTKDQQKAINDSGRNILVAAAAGSGKTRVLVERIIRQLVHKELSVDELLVVTFTNAAAAEMRERIEAALQERLLVEEDAELAAWLERQSVLLTGADICTFHSFCQKIIRQNIDAVDADPQFRLAGEQELVLLKRDVLEELLEQRYERPEREDEREDWEGFLSFADDYGDDKGDETLYDAVLKLYNFSQSQPCPAEWLRRQQDDYAAAEPLLATKWFQTVLPSMGLELDRLIAEYRALAGLVHDAGPEMQEMWQPYAGLAETDAEELAAIRRALRHCEKSQEEGSFDAVKELAEKLKWGRIAGKAFKPLKELHPDLREAFDEKRNKLKKQFKEQWTEKYLNESEAEILERIAASGAAVGQYTRLVIDYIAALQAAKKERNILDFNDLEHYALEILCADPDKLMQAEPEYVPTEIARGMKEQFAAIMVDEYQDTNSVQEAILSLIARENNRFMVGDVKQSIYRFRLADPHLFQAKYDSFPEHPAAEDADELITMRQNFRSRAEVLAPINCIFDQVMTREAAEIEYDERSRLYPGAAYPEQEHTLKGPVELDILVQQPKEQAESSSVPQDAATAEEDGSSGELDGFELEAQHIAERIQQLMGEGRLVFDKEEKRYRLLELRDIAILLRAVREKADILLETLRRSSIPAYADVNGGYFEASEVRLMLALLSVLDNARQDIPLAAVMASPIGGFSMEELVKIRLSAEQGDFYDGLLASFSVDSKLPREIAGRAAHFQQELSAWRSYALSHSVPELIWMLYRKTGYYDYVGGLKGGLLRQANLRMLADRAADYERTNYRGLFRFLRFLENLQKRDTDLAAARTLGASENVVRIMSIHKSKGLEFPVVFVADMGKGFNLRDAKDTFLMHQQLGIGLRLAERSHVGRQIYNTLPWQAVSDQIVRESKAEEMRILYVAMTRAREKLILTGMLTEAKAERKKKSWGRYLQEQQVQFPAACIQQAEDYLDWVAPAVARHADGAPLRDFLAGNAENTGNAGNPALSREPDAHFAVRIISAAEVGKRKDGDRPDDALLKAAELRMPMPSTPEKSRVEACLSWSYDLRGLDEVPAKLTVTELKHRFAGQDTAEETGIAERQLVAPPDEEEKEKQREFEWPRPQFLKEKRTALSAAERGTIMHTAMQHIDLHGDMSFSGIQRQLARMEQAGILLPGQKETIYIKGIQSFAVSQIGARLRQAVKVWRELPFSRMLSAKRFFPQVEEETERVFTQGVIDLLFEEADGGLVLVDYKTDRSSDAEKALQRYRIQVELYCEAVNEILQRPVRECYLYLLQSGQMIKVPESSLQANQDG